MKENIENIVEKDNNAGWVISMQSVISGKLLAAMSGGVDSSVAALLAKEQGFDCEGAMMKLYGDESFNDAYAVAAHIGLPFQILDFSSVFTTRVIDHFISEYMRGATPNPCVECNRHIKFGLFLENALNAGYDHIATGHYARIEFAGGRYLLKKGADQTKDQSYVLYSLTQETLSRVLLPLGGLTKTNVRDIALEHGLPNASKNESQDICFIPDGDYSGFIERTAGIVSKPGRFIDTEGRDLGEHKGFHRYTIGQRRGIGLSAVEPFYVCSIDPVTNAVVVGTHEKIFSKALTAHSINLISADTLDSPVRVTAKIRYKQPEQPATVWQLDDDTLRVEFDEPQRAITRGQSVVLYDGDTVIGGGIII